MSSQMYRFYKYIYDIKQNYNNLTILSPRPLQDSLRSISQIYDFNDFQLTLYNSLKNIYDRQIGMAKGSVTDFSTDIPVSKNKSSIFNIMHNSTRLYYIEKKRDCLHLPIWVQGKYICFFTLYDFKNNRENIESFYADNTGGKNDLEKSILTLRQLVETIIHHEQQYISDFKLRKTMQSYQGMAEINKQLSVSLPLNEILSNICHSIIYSLNFDNAVIYVADTENELLEPRVRCSFYEESRAITKKKKKVPFCKDSKTDPFSKELSEVFKNSPVIPSHIYTHPVKRDNNLLGYIVVHKLISLMPITGEDKNNLDIISGQISISIENERLYSTIEKVSIVDSLTNLYNSRYLFDALTREIEYSKRNHLNFGLLILDVDNFKKYNDTYGHLFGDLVLKEFAKLLTECTRTNDIVARYGGDEFVVVLLYSSMETNKMIAGRILEAVKKLRIKDGRKKVKMSTSIGGTLYRGEETSIKDILAQADKALYLSKRKGKACYSYFGEKVD